MATPQHIQEGQGEETSRKHVQGLCRHFRSLDIPVELHQ